MKNYRNHITFTAILFAGLILPMISHSQTVDKTPYTPQQVVDKISKYYANPGNDDIRALGISQLFMNDPKADAFNHFYFGTCQPAYPFNTNDSSDNGTIAFSELIAYIVSDKLHDSKDHHVTMMKNSLDQLETGLTQGNYSNVCNKAPAAKYMANLKGLIDQVNKASPQINAGVQQYLDAQAGVSAKNVAAMNAQRNANAAQVYKEQSAYVAKGEKLTACEVTKAYSVYSLSLSITRMQNDKAGFQRVIQQQKDGAASSGYVDKDVMYNMGQKIASADKHIAEDFASYKQAGGSAWSSDSVKLVADPCVSLK